MSDRTKTGQRWNELRGEEVVYAIHRQERTFLPSRDHCPLCPTRQGERAGGLDERAGAAGERAGVRTSMPGLRRSVPRRGVGQSVPEG